MLHQRGQRHLDVAVMDVDWIAWTHPRRNSMNIARKRFQIRLCKFCHMPSCCTELDLLRDRIEGGSAHQIIDTDDWSSGCGESTVDGDSHQITDPVRPVSVFERFSSDDFGCTIENDQRFFNVQEAPTCPIASSQHQPGVVLWQRGGSSKRADPRKCAGCDGSNGEKCGAAGQWFHGWFVVLTEENSNENVQIHS